MLTIQNSGTDGWLAALAVRRSRRRFDGTAVSPEDLQVLRECIERFRPTHSARIVLLDDAPSDLFRGLVGSYGRIEGASSAMVFIGRQDAQDVQEALGYLGEGLVLEATRLGLTTCWVGGLFKPGVAREAVELEPGESVYAVTPVGHAASTVPSSERMIYGAGKPKSRKSLEDIAPGFSEWPSWARSTMRAAQVAPSAMHRQPWRFRMEDGTLVVGYDGAGSPKVSKRLDCGIAMLHVELAAQAEGVTGTWHTALENPDVARFVPTSKGT
ncbi:MAG: nitroreductase [Actinomycetota bacterium]|jgi:nitroreductase|nr:nitroreductase [Actinomycetota bacterium]